MERGVGNDVRPSSIWFVFSSVSEVHIAGIIHGFYLYILLNDDYFRKSLYNTKDNSNVDLLDIAVANQKMI